MLFVFGTRLAGKVDQVDGIGHVATRFAHVQFLPLLPLSSYLVLSQHDNARIEIPFSYKSVVVAWFRTVLLVAMAAAGIFALVAVADNDTVNAVIAGVCMLVGVGLHVVLARLVGWGRASDERRAELLAYVERALA